MPGRGGATREMPRSDEGCTPRETRSSTSERWKSSPVSRLRTVSGRASGLASAIAPLLLLLLLPPPVQPAASSAASISGMSNRKVREVI